jgi:FKBP-type peptidyl-prolyl cis-trans isomerase
VHPFDPSCAAAPATAAELANTPAAAATIEGVSFQPRDVPVGPIRLQLGSGDVIEGLQDALVGMRQGGKRRVLIPPELGYVSSVLQPQPPTFATKRQLANHSSESLLFEIELLRVLPA